MILIAVVAASVALFVARLYAASHVGFGDAEALYACYARHPQPVYLDHPGLIGVLARLFGRGDVPSPLAAHVGTALLATAAPWTAALAARGAGASWTRAALAAGVLLLAPEISVGLFGMTPDLLLLPLWYAATGLALVALRAPVGSTRALVAFLASGFAAGLACDAKVSGVLLVAGLGVAWTGRHARDHRSTLAPWAGLALALLVVSPLAMDEIERGFPMLRHRLVHTQGGAGPSLRNLGVLVGGQLVYVTPPLLYAAFRVAQDLYRRRRDDAISGLLWSVTASGLPLVLLALVSPRAEPHWVAPLYLALPLHFALREERRSAGAALVGPLLARTAAGVGALALVLAHVWVLSDLAPKWLGQRYEPRYDVANDLYAWNTGLPLVQRALAQSVNLAVAPPIVVGPHWVVCAQLHAGLPGSVLVGCEGPIADDFDRWLPRSTWERAPILLYVTDDRFDEDPARAFPERRLEATWEVDVERSGVTLRHIRIARLVKSASAAR